MSDELRSGPPRYLVELKLDGKPLPLKGFIHDILGGAVYGMIEGLKGFESCETIDVCVRRNPHADTADDHA